MMRVSTPRVSLADLQRALATPFVDPVRIGALEMSRAKARELERGFLGSKGE